MFERIARDAIIGYLNSQHLSYGAQHGFRSGNSILNKPISALNTVNQLLDIGKDIDKSFLDVNKAFNVNNHRFSVQSMLPVTCVPCCKAEVGATAFEIWSLRKLQSPCCPLGLDYWTLSLPYYIQ